jgi:hypothetical protein
MLGIFQRSVCNRQYFRPAFHRAKAKLAPAGLYK